MRETWDWTAAGAWFGVDSRTTHYMESRFQTDGGTYFKTICGLEINAYRTTPESSWNKPRCRKCIRGKDPASAPPYRKHGLSKRPRKLREPFEWVGGYTLHLYCDRANPEHVQTMLGEFAGQTLEHCMADARAAGWKIHSRTRTATCPKCLGRPETTPQTRTCHVPGCTHIPTVWSYDEKGACCGNHDHDCPYWRKA